MTIEEFLNGLRDAGMPFAEDDPDYCSECDSWQCTCGLDSPYDWDQD